MSSVTKRISQIEQPIGGYVSPKLFIKIKVDSEEELNNEENISPAVIGLAVDYLTRFMLNHSVEKAFHISLLGAMLAPGNQLENAEKLCQNISGINDESVISAIKLASYDVCYRAGNLYFRSVETINPDKETIRNVQIMVKRSLIFFSEHGPVTLDGFKFKGAYTSTVNAGDGDFLTEKTLWDFKVSKKDTIDSKYSLQLLMYYIMGLHSKQPEFNSIKNLGIYNPRLNIISVCPLDRVSKDIIKKVEDDVICYDSK